MNTPDERTELIEDALGEFGFRVRWRYLKHWADVEVFAIVGREMSEPPKTLFHKKEYRSSEDTVYSIDEAEPYLKGFIKWDGCAELDQGCEHWCGVHCFKKHAALVEYLWKRSRELMPSGDIMDEPSWEEATW